MKAKLRLALELERLHRHNLQKMHPLRQLFWESTLRCNVHCLHCGSDCRNEEQTPDMPFADFLKAIDSITPHVDPHKVLIIISGGEPTVRKDLEENGRELMRRGFPWGMVTNGLMMTPELYIRLRRAGLLSMTVSLDGFEPEHNWLRRHPHSWEHAVNTIKLLVADSTMTWDVVTCVNQRTIGYLPELKDFLWGLGVRNWRIFGIDPMGRAATQPELLLTDEQFKYLMDFIRQCRQQGDHVSYSCEGFLGDYEGEVRDYLYQCGAGISVASVLIDGSISACTSIRGKYYQGNIYKDDFWEVWENRFEQYRNRDWMRKTEPCKDCKVFRYCEGNGMHLRREDGSLMLCHLHRIEAAQ